MIRGFGLAVSAYLLLACTATQAIPLDVLPAQPNDRYTQGLEALKQDRFELAESLGTHYVSGNPDDGHAHLVLLMSWYGQQRHDSIHNHLLELDEKMPGISRPLRLVVAELYLKNRAPLKAVETLTPIPESRRDASAWSLLAEAYVNLGELANAEDGYRQVLRKDAADQTAALGLARVLMTQGEFAQALSYAQSVLTTHPDSQPGLVLATTLHLRLNQPEAASTLAEKLKTQKPDVASTLSLIALTEFASGNYAEARTSFRSLDDRPAWKDLSVAGVALSQLKMGDTGSTRATLDENAFEPEVLTALLKTAFVPAGHIDDINRQLRQLAPVWVDAKREGFDLSPAIEVAAKNSVSVNPEVTTAAIRFLFLSQGFPELAASQPDNAETRRHQSLLEGLMASRALAKEGQLKSAVSLLKQLIDQYPEFVAPKLELADIHFLTGSPDLAVEGYREAIKQAPELDELVLRLGNLYNATQKPERALEQYREYLARDPDSSYALNQAAATLSALLNQPNEALPLAQRAYSLSPDNHNVADTLINIYLKLGRRQEAEQVAESFNALL